MKLKYKIKELSPPRLLRLLRLINQLRLTPGYYLPYLFLDGKSNQLRRLTMELTYRCNLRCEMCPLAQDLRKKDSRLLLKQMRNNETELADVKHIIKQACELGVREITLTGGEPFLRKDLMEIIKEIKCKKLHCTIITNGGVIGESNIPKLVDMKVDKMVFSLDGPKEVHNRIRNNSKIYDKLIKAVELIQTEKLRKGTNIPDVSLSCTISSLNYMRLAEVMDIGKTLRVNINYAYLYYTTDEMMKETEEIIQVGSTKGEDQDIPHELKQIDVGILLEEIKMIRKNEKEYGIKASFSPPLNKREIYERFYDDDASYTNKCFYPWFATRIGPYGDVYPCSMDICMGNVRDQNLSEIWCGDKYVKFRKALRKQKLFPKCKKCCALNTKIWSFLPSWNYFRHN